MILDHKFLALCDSTEVTVALYEGTHCGSSSLYLLPITFVPNPFLIDFLSRHFIPPSKRTSNFVSLLMIH